MTLEITAQNIDSFVTSGKLLIIDFWAGWCGPCKAISPIIDELVIEYADRVNIGKCDVEENDDITVKYKIRNVPTIIFIKNNEVIDTLVGATTKQALQEKIEAYL